MHKLLCAAVLLTGPFAFVQVRETISVHVVEVPVTVVGSDGNPVRGLTAKNFEVYDGREKRTISGFDTIDFASKKTMTAISPINPVARRNFLLLFDLTFSTPKGLEHAQQAASEFVSKELQPRDVAAVGTIQSEKGFELMTAFTTDRSLLLAAIAHPTKIRLDDPLLLSGSNLTREDVASNEGMGGKFGGELADIAAHSQWQDDKFVRGRVDREMNALGALAQALRAISGRKQIVLLTEGFDPRLVSGRDAQDTGTEARENAAISSGNLINVDTESRYGSSASLGLLDKMASYFRGSDVVLHAIDIQGLRVQSDVVQGRIINSSNSLDLLSRPTGGQVFKASNSLVGDFANMLRAQEVVYVLAFQAPSTGSGKFHDLKVKLVDVPGSAKVFARAGYYELGSQSAVERTLSNAEIVMNDIPQQDVHVTALAASFPTTTEVAQVPVILEIGGEGLLKAAKVSAADAQVYIYAFDQNGVVRDRIYQKISLALNKVGAKLKAGGMKYYGTLALPPGTYAVKSLVRADETDVRGFARTEVVVPNGRQLAIAAPVFVEEGKTSWVMVKGTSHDKSNAYPFELGGQTFVPTTRATAESRKFTVLVWNASPNELTWQTSPSAKLLGQMQSGSATKLIFELDKFAPRTALDVTVQKKGAADAPVKLSVPMTE